MESNGTPKSSSTWRAQAAEQIKSPGYYSYPREGSARGKACHTRRRPHRGPPNADPEATRGVPRTSLRGITREYRNQCAGWTEQQIFLNGPPLLHDQLVDPSWGPPRNSVCLPSWPECVCVCKPVGAGAHVCLLPVLQQFFSC